MNEAIQNDAVKFILRANFSQDKQVQAKETVKATSESHASVTPLAAAMPIQGSTGNDKPAQPVKRDSSKVGRNDPCPCGSGKKYKDCCGKK